MSHDGHENAPAPKRIKLESSPSPGLEEESSVKEKPGPEIIDEEHCAICLQPVEDRTVVPSCSHEFCFECLVIWCDQSRRCPLCSQTIGQYLIHRIRSKYDYQKHYLLPLRSSPPPLQTSASSSGGGRAQTSNRALQRAARERVWGRRQRQQREEADRFDRAIEKRKWIYHHDLYAKHVASNTFTRYRPYPTPAKFAASQEYISRTTAFLRRELQVWPNLDVEFLTTFIISIMKSIDIRSESAVKLLAEFLDLDAPYAEGGRHVNAEHFAHEVYSYVRSPYKDLFVYDSVVQYDLPAEVPPFPDRIRSRRWFASQSRSRSPPQHSPRHIDSHDRRSRTRSRSRSRSLSWSPSGRRYPSTRDRRRPRSPDGPSSIRRHDRRPSVSRSSFDHDDKHRTRVKGLRESSPGPSKFRRDSDSWRRDQRVRDRSRTRECEDKAAHDDEEYKVYARVHAPSGDAQNGYEDPKGKRKADETQGGVEHKDSTRAVDVLQNNKDSDHTIGSPISNFHCLATNEPRGGIVAASETFTMSGASHTIPPRNQAENKSRRAPRHKSLLESVHSHLSGSARQSQSVARASGGTVDLTKHGDVPLFTHARSTTDAPSLLQRLSDPQSDIQTSDIIHSEGQQPRSAPGLSDNASSPSHTCSAPFITLNPAEDMVTSGQSPQHHTNDTLELSAPQIMARTRARLAQLKGGDASPHSSQPPISQSPATRGGLKIKGASVAAKASPDASLDDYGISSRAGHLARSRDIDDPDLCATPSSSGRDKNTASGKHDSVVVVVSAEDSRSACALTTEPTVSATMDLRARLMAKLAEQKMLAGAAGVDHAGQSPTSDMPDAGGFSPPETRATTQSHPNNVALQDPQAMENALRTRAKLRVRLAQAKRTSMNGNSGSPVG